MARNNKSRQTDNQLPEWAKSRPEDPKDFTCDFAHPDSPKINPNKPSNLNDIQMFDVVHGKGVIGLIDRRASGRQNYQGTDLEKEIQSKSESKDLDPQKNITNKLRDKRTKTTSSEYVLIIKGKLIGTGSLNDISEVLLNILADHSELEDKDISVLKKISLQSILDYISKKY